MSRATTYAKRTITRIIGKEKVSITAELHGYGKQTPSFSVTGHARSKFSRSGNSGSFGQVQHNYLGHFPEFEPYYDWHLVSFDGPMHYIANTLFWYGKFQAGGDYRRRTFYNRASGRIEEDLVCEHDAETCLEYAERSACWGMLPGEEPGQMPEAAEEAGYVVLDAFLRDRLNNLRDEFTAAMEELFGTEPVRKALDAAYGEED